MVWWLFRKKRDDDINEKFVNLHESLHSSFSNIKRDMTGINKWLDHFKSKHENHDKKFDLLNQRINSIEEVLEEMQGVWTTVQTAVQTGGLSKQSQTDSRPNTRLSLSKQDEEELSIARKLKKLTLMERAVVWALLNTDLKLSYEDLSVALGKDKSTLRGQINNIKTKSEGLIEEYPEKDGKKRFCISDKIKSEVLKGVKKKETIQQKVKKVKSENHSNS